MMKIKIFFMAAFFILGASLAFAQQAVVIKLEGSVEVKVDAASAWQQAQEGQLLEAQSQVKTGPTGKVTIAFGPDRSNIIMIEKNTETVIEQIKPGAVYLPKGRVFTIIRDLSQIENFEIKTPTAIAGARGTGWVTEVAESGKTEVSVFDDIVAVKGLDESGKETGQIDVHEDFSTSVSSDGKYEDPKPVSEETKEELNKVSQEVIKAVQEFDPNLVDKKQQPGPKDAGRTPPVPPTTVVPPMTMAPPLQPPLPPINSTQPLPPRDMNQPRDPARSTGDFSTGGQPLPPRPEGQPNQDGAFNNYMDQFRSGPAGPPPEGSYNYSGDHYFGEFDQQWDGQAGTFVQYDPYLHPQEVLEGGLQPICPCYAQCYQPGVQCSPSCYQVTTVCQPPPNPPGCFCSSGCTQACSPVPPPPPPSN